MNLEDKIRIMYNQILYNKFGFKNAEEQFQKAGIQPKIINEPTLNKYFFLINPINLNNLDNTLSNKIIKYFNNDQSVSEEEIISILINHYKEILRYDTTEKLIYCGPINYKYLVPTDSINIAFHYIKPASSEIESFLFKQLNYIQELFYNQNIKVTIVPCDELCELKINSR